MSAEQQGTGELVDEVTRDHAQIRELLDRIQGSRQDEFRDDLIREALEALDRHARTDEERLHPLAREVLDDGTEVTSSLQHAGIQADMAALRELPREDVRYETSLNDLVDRTRQHLAAEQQVLGRLAGRG